MYLLQLDTSIYVHAWGLPLVSTLKYAPGERAGARRRTSLVGRDTRQGGSVFESATVTLRADDLGRGCPMRRRRDARYGLCTKN